MDGQRKVVLLVLDGATFDVIRPLAAQGELPHLASLLARGASAELTSSVPFVTPTAFSTILTGVNPGRHGIFDFTADSHATHDAGPLVDRRQLRVRPLWDLLGPHGRRAIVVTVPFTYPPAPLHGVMLCVGNVAEGPFRTFPEELAPELLARIGGYEERHRHVVRPPEGTPSQAFTDDWIARCHYQAEKTTQATRYLMGAYPWDFLMATLVITDRLQHYFWRCMDPDHPAHDPATPPRYRNVIREAYRKADASLGEILRAVPEDAHLIVMSDHGFGSLDYVFFTNVWLRRQGLLSLKPPRYRWGLRTPTLARGLARAGLPGIAGRLPAAVGGLRVPLPGRRPEWPESPVQAVDWERTGAYATRWGININLRGREPFGAVEPGPAADRLAEGILRGLRAVRDPRSGRPLFDLLARKEELYVGPHAGEGHDILIASNGRGTVLRKDLDAPEVLREVTAADLGNGDHRREGIFIAAGPEVAPGALPGRPRLEDIAPTVLHLLGLPVPGYMDGAVVTACLRPEALARRPVAFAAAVSSDPAPASPAGAAEPDEDEEQVRAQLKGLGYLG